LLLYFVKIKGMNLNTFIQTTLRKFDLQFATRFQAFTHTDF